MQTRGGLAYAFRVDHAGRVPEVPQVRRGRSFRDKRLIIATPFRPDMPFETDAVSSDCPIGAFIGRQLAGETADPLMAHEFDALAMRHSEVGQKISSLMRSKLFVPGSRPELFDKAWRTDADALSFDLEDAVPADSKARARALVSEALNHAPRPRSKITIVRVNRLDGPDFDEDIQAVVQPGLDVINLPKIEDAQAVREAARKLNELEGQRPVDRRIGILVNIETPRGLRNAASIAASSDRIAGLQLGFGDLFAPLGIEMSLATMTPIWLALRLAAAEAGVPAYDAAFVRVSDLEAFRAEAMAARSIGFAGKSCVHPTQVPIANSVFFPSAIEIDTARRVVSHADEMDARGVGAFVMDGVMYDGPFVARAREILRLSETGARGG